MLLHRDATIVALALGIAAVLYGASFRDLIATGAASGGLRFGIESLRLPSRSKAGTTGTAAIWATRPSSRSSTTVGRPTW
jgi:hypothetical protein